MKQFIGNKLKTNKPFGFALILIALFGIAGTIFQIVGFDSILRPYLFKLPEGVQDAFPTAACLYPAFTQNNVSGTNQLAYFTVISNILTNLYLLALGLSIVGVKKAQKFGFNKYFGGAVTMFISITGIIYTTIMLPFFDYALIGWTWTFPGIAMYDFLGYWQHMVLPVVMLVVWHLPFSTERLDKKKLLRTSMFFPVTYAIFTLTRGFFGGLYPTAMNPEGFLIGEQTWFPYPFLASDRFYPYVQTITGQAEPSWALVNFMTALVYVLVIAVMVATPILIAKVHNKLCTNLEKKYTFLDD